MTHYGLEVNENEPITVFFNVFSFLWRNHFTYINLKKVTFAGNSRIMVEPPGLILEEKCAINPLLIALHAGNFVIC